MILVPSDRSGVYDQVRRALDAASVPFVDYVLSINRRDIAEVDSIRLCTFHSSRGLEGQRVIIFGFEGITRMCSQVNTAVEKLSYIVLSRATIDLILVALPAQRGTDISFVQAALNALRPM